MKPCPVCRGATDPAGDGLLKCRACGLAFKGEKYFGSPVYQPGIEGDIYTGAKKELFDAALDRLQDLLRGPGRLLDVGCAGGDLLKAAAGRGWRGEGVEIDPALAGKAVEAGFKVHMSPVEAAGLEEAAYDAATVFEVFCLMGSPAEAVAGIYRALKPGGVIYIREFNAVFHLPLRRLELAGVFKPLGASPAVIHNFNFSPRSLRALLGRAGFREIKIRNSRPTSGDPYRTGGRLGGLVTGLLKFLYYTLAQALWYASFGRVYAGSSLIVTACK